MTTYCSLYHAIRQYFERILDNDNALMTLFKHASGYLLLGICATHLLNATPFFYHKEMLIGDPMRKVSMRLKNITSNGTILTFEDIASAAHIITYIVNNSATLDKEVE